jgi:hypothetical protein
MAKFTLYRVEDIITEELWQAGDYASSKESEKKPATFREALDALHSDCWDTIDERWDGMIICYPADYQQDYTNGDYSLI